MKPSEIIREARTVLFERGWYQGGFEGPDGSVCFVGALNVAAAGNPSALVITREMRSVGDALKCAGHYGVSGWNDAPGRTFGEVIDLLDEIEKYAQIAEKS